MTTENDWAQRWLRLMLALSAVALLVPGSLEHWNVESYRTSLMPQTRVLAMVVPSVWLVACLVALNASWKGRARVLAIAALAWPLIDLYQLAMQQSAAVELKLPVLVGALSIVRGIVVVCALGLVAAVIHARRRGLSGRPRSWMLVAALVALASLAARVVARDGLADALDPGLYNRRYEPNATPIFSQFVVGLAALVFYGSYLVLALVAGITGSSKVRRVVSLAARASIPVLIFLSLRWAVVIWGGGRHPPPSHWSLLAVQSGARLSMSYLLAGMAWACWFESRTASSVDVRPDLFD